MSDVQNVLRRVADELYNLSAGGPTEALSIRFVDAVANATPTSCTPSRVGVVDHMEAIGSPLRDDLLTCTPMLPWRPSHRVDDGGAGVALLDFGECLDLGSLTVGAMAVGPHNIYPEHEHPPVEMYLILGGTADWRHGGSTEYVQRGVGDMVVNHPNQRHGVRTGDEDVLAVYVLDT